MSPPSLSTFLLALSLAITLNTDPTYASPLPESLECSTLSDVSFLRPRSMSVLGIRQECDDLRVRERDSSRSFFRRAVDAISSPLPTYELGEPIADESELHGRSLSKQKRNKLEGIPHNPMVPGSEEEGTQEPFEALTLTMSEVHDGLRMDVGRDDRQDDVRFAGLPIPRPFLRPCLRSYGSRSQWKHSTVVPSASSRDTLVHMRQRAWTGLQKWSDRIIVAVMSVDDDLAAAAAVAIGVVILVLLTVETVLGRRRLRSTASPKAGLRDRLQVYKRIASRRQFNRSLETIPEHAVGHFRVEEEVDDCEEKRALLLSLTT